MAKYKGTNATVTFHGKQLAPCGIVECQPQPVPDGLASFEVTLDPEHGTWKDIAERVATRFRGSLRILS